MAHAVYGVKRSPCADVEQVQIFLTPAEGFSGRVAISTSGMHGVTLHHQQ